MRIAETRTVNRVLCKAYGIGLCSVEEIGSFNPTSEPVAAVARKIPPTALWLTLDKTGFKSCNRPFCESNRGHNFRRSASEEVFKKTYKGDGEPSCFLFVYTGP